MGCGVSKSDETALVSRCRERKELIRAAANHRFELVAAHVAYFRSLKDVGDALRKFVDEEIVFAASSSSSSSSSAASSPQVALHSSNGAEAEVVSGGDSKQTLEHQHKAVPEDKTRFNARDFHDENFLHFDLSSSSSSTGESEFDHDHDHGHGDGHLHDHHHHHHNRGEHHDNNVMRGEREAEVISPFAHRDNWEQNPHSYPPYGFNQPSPYQPPPPQSHQPQVFWGGDGGAYYSMNPPPPYQGWGMPYGNGNTNVYYMKKASSEMRTVVQEPEPMANGYTTSYWNNPAQSGGFLGYPMGAPPTDGGRESGDRKQVELPPPPPKVSVWDFINPFNAVDSGYQGYYLQSGYGYGHVSVVSSPDSDEVREREGIPKLEEETESEVYRQHLKSNKLSEGMREDGGGSSSRAAPLHKGEDNSGGLPSQLRSEVSPEGVSVHKTSNEGMKQAPSNKFNEGRSVEMPSHSGQDTAVKESSQYHNDSSVLISSEDEDEITESIDHLTEEKSGSNPTTVKSMGDGHVKKKGVTFDLDDTSKHDFDSSKLTSLTTVSGDGNRDLQQVVAEIRDDFEIASSYGKEVAIMLEVGKLPYQPSFIKVVLSRIISLVAPSSSESHIRSLQSVELASKTMKLAKSFFADFGEDISHKYNHLSSTLDELCAWEKKLYKEVKVEERLRIIYEKQWKRLKHLDQQGAESRKIDAAQASIRNLLTKLNISIKAINAISSKIHKLRDNDFHPQVSELIHGMIQMWKSMLQCHQKQFRAIMQSKIHTLKANTAFERESSVRATLDLHMELVSWSSRFTDWISTQKLFVESLNSWLLRCLDYQPEETPDGPVPFSPGRLGAPPIFVICHDWNQALESISESSVSDAMQNFASILRQMWEKQDEEHRQRVKADYISKDYKQRIKSFESEKGKRKLDHEAMPDKTGVSQLDDLKVDLDSLRKRLGEERAKHKDAIKIVHDAASTSIQGGLVPIFKALENFTSEVLKAHEQIRLEKVQQT